MEELGLGEGGQGFRAQVGVSRRGWGRCPRQGLFGVRKSSLVLRSVSLLNSSLFLWIWRRRRRRRRRSVVVVGRVGRVFSVDFGVLVVLVCVSVVGRFLQLGLGRGG